MSVGPTRVTLVLNALHGGGAEFVGRTWAGRLAELGHDVTLMVLEQPTAEQVRQADVSVPFVVVGTSWWRRVRVLRRQLGTGRSDAVVAMQMYPNLLVLLLAATRLRRRRALVAISERNLVSIDAAPPSRSHRLKVAIAKRAYGRADVMIAISHPVAAEMVAAFGVDAEAVRVVPNPAALLPATIVSTPAPDLVDGVELVVVGRLVAQKRVGLALDVARELSRRGVAVRLSIFGDGPLRPQLDDPDLDIVHHGWVEDWPSRCHTNSVLLLASVKEGFGNVLVEAACRHVPAVAVSSALGVADAVVPGITGALALDARPATVADAVLAARRCTFEGADAWLERFTPQTSTDLLLAALTRGERP